MRLNKESRIQLRKNVEGQLKNVPDGMRIHLDKDILEQLLFETSIVKLSDDDTVGDELSRKQLLVKYLIWSGPFLSKIDLSEVSFDGVCWDIKYNDNEQIYENAKNLYREFGVKNIDLSNTNAKIDFSKAFTFDVDDIQVVCCDFSNTDLSNNVIDYNFCTEKCNFSGTRLKVNFKSKSDIRFYSSILSGLDFSEYTVDETFFGEEYQQYMAHDCDLSSTGLRVKTTKIPSDILSKYRIWLDLRKNLHASKNLSKKREQQIQMEMGTLYKEFVDYREQLYGMEYLGEAISHGYLVGCYVNDKKIMTNDEKHTLANEKLKEYETYEHSLFSLVNIAIEEQIRSLKKQR